MKLTGFYFKYLTILLALLTTRIHAQAPVLEWAKPLTSMYGAGYGKDIKVDNEGNVCITGQASWMTDYDPGPGTFYGMNGSDYIAKYDANGQLIWVDTITSANLEISSFALDAYNNIYAVGRIVGTADFDPGPGVTVAGIAGTFDDNIFIAKYSSSGIFKWVKIIGGHNHDGAESVFVRDDKIHFTGSFGDTVDFDAGPGSDIHISNGLTDIYFASYDTSGNFLTAKSIGSQYLDYGHSIAVSPVNNDIIIAGHVTGNLDFDPGPGTSIGICFSPGTYVNGFFSRYSSTGQFISGHVYYSSEPNMCYKVVIDKWGNFFVSGYHQSYIDLDPGPSNYLLAGSPSGSGFFAKYNLAGNPMWGYTMGAGTNACYTTGTAVDSLGNYYVSGYFEGTVDAEPGPGTHNLVANGQNDVFFAKYTTWGGLFWAESFGGKNYDVNHSMAVDNNMGVYLTGYFSDTCDFDPHANTTNLVCPGPGIYAMDIYFAKYLWCDPTTQNDCFSTYVNEKEISDSFTIFPNPSNGNFTIQSDKFLKNATVSIYNMNGSLVHSISSQSGNNINLNLNIAKGIYLVEVVSGNKVMREKLVIH